MNIYEYIDNKFHNKSFKTTSSALKFIDSFTYVVKYKYEYNYIETIYCFNDFDIAFNTAYKKAHILFLQQQVVDNGDIYQPIYDNFYLKQYVDNVEHTTIISKDPIQHKSTEEDEEYRKELYSSIDITNNSNNIFCISNFKNIICFGIPEKYEILCECENGCCNVIKWKHHYEYTFTPFITIEEFDGNYSTETGYVKFINTEGDYLLK